MKNIYSKSDFPKAPGKDRYPWKEANTMFEVPEDGKYIIAISAAAKNAAQNKSSDDDDLRVEIDGYKFGQHEVHQNKISWKGFGTAAAWDGASLQGGSKTIYFFTNLSSGKHTIRFWADETPAVKEIRVLYIEQTQSGAIEDVILEFHEQAPGQKVDVHGIPWKSFIFAPGFNIVELVDILATCQSAVQKGRTDGDNIKVYVNGQIVHNPAAPTSDKYKNFFFSGDLSQGKKEALMLHGREFLLNEQDVSLELWYDETPTLEQVKFELRGNSQYVQPNTLKRRIMDIAEAMDLPVNLWDEWSKIYYLAGHALDIALQYAEEHSFTTTDDEGRLRRLVEDNEPDALRHFTWNVFLTQAIDEEGATIITTTHETFWMEVNNKQELSRAGVMDMWNNKQGREFAIQSPGKGYLELFKMAKSEDKLILNLGSVTEEHRKEVERIIHDMQK